MMQAEGTGHAQHCPYVTVWRGRFKDGAASGTPSRRAMVIEPTRTPFSASGEGVGPSDSLDVTEKRNVCCVCDRER
jgi:hypothetical protein